MGFMLSNEEIDYGLYIDVQEGNFNEAERALENGANINAILWDNPIIN